MVSPRSVLSSLQSSIQPMVRRRSIDEGATPMEGTEALEDPNYNPNPNPDPADHHPDPDPSSNFHPERWFLYPNLNSKSNPSRPCLLLL